MHSDTTRETFLRHLARFGTVDAASSRAEVGRATVYRWRDEDARFQERWDDAIASFRGRLQAEMVEAFEGAGRWVAKGPALQPLVKLHAGFHPELSTQRHQHEHAHAIYFFDVPDTPILSEVPAPLDAGYRDGED